MIYIGCSGWSYIDWKKVFYPKQLRPQEYFTYYSSHFNTVEINNTFYHFPSQKTVQAWYHQAPQGFKYSLKASRYITHIYRFTHIQEALKRLYGLSDILGEKMGYFLFQFPESYHFSNENLDQILSQLNSNYKNVIELRHPSWWTSGVFQALKAQNILFCTVSGFDLPEKIIVQNRRAYIRFHGDPTYSVSYTPQELATWAHGIKEASLNEVWAYFNNTAKAYAIQNATQLLKLCK